MPGRLATGPAEDGTASLPDILEGQRPDTTDCGGTRYGVRGRRLCRRLTYAARLAGCATQPRSPRGPGLRPT
jgi:hypothetical protein